MKGKKHGLIFKHRARSCERLVAETVAAHELPKLLWMNSIQDTAISLSRSLDAQKVGHLSEYLRHWGEYVCKSKTSWICAWIGKIVTYLGELLILFHSLGRQVGCCGLDHLHSLSALHILLVEDIQKALNWYLEMQRSCDSLILNLKSLKLRLLLNIFRVNWNIKVIVWSHIKWFCLKYSGVKVKALFWTTFFR